MYWVFNFLSVEYSIGVWGGCLTPARCDQPADLLVMSCRAVGSHIVLDIYFILEILVIYRGIFYLLT